MTLVVTLALGLVIGTVLGALGGGGAILTVPALVYLLGQPAGEATTGSLVIVGLTSAVGVLSHARSGHVRWRTGLAFGASGTLAALLGTVVNRHVAPDVLLLIFAAFMVLAATGMLLRTRPGDEAGAEQDETAAPTTPRTRLLPLVVAGAGVGFLTGFLGVGGGFIIVPALVLAIGLPMSAAVGTSLLVIVINSAAALLARAGTASFDWAVVAPFTLAAMVGTLGGKRIADRLPAAVATRAFAVLILVVAGYTVLHTLIG
ncbi:sulfite exporter TauE/SafE family protein [Micromonospora sp. NPDC003197]